MSEGTEVRAVTIPLLGIALGFTFLLALFRDLRR